MFGGRVSINQANFGSLQNDEDSSISSIGKNILLPSHEANVVVFFIEGTLAYNPSYLNHVSREMSEEHLAPRNASQDSNNELPSKS